MKLYVAMISMEAKNELDFSCYFEVTSKCAVPCDVIASFFLLIENTMRTNISKVCIQMINFTYDE